MTRSTLRLAALAAACAAASAVLPDTRPAADAAVRAAPKFGMNLSAVNDWTQEWAFVDAFKHSRPWSDASGNPAPVDEAGNLRLQPGQSAWTLCLRENGGRYPAGKYVLTWKGTGRVEMKRWDVKRVLNQSANRIEAEVGPGDGGVQIDVAESSPSDPVRDFRLWLPGFEDAKSPFHPAFLERLKGVGAVRFMDWQRTNNSPVRSWADRAKPDDARYSTEKGVPLEVMIDLANTLRADPWFCVPHQADDEYVREFAKVVKARLAPDRRAYVEFSNEVWNWQFEQTKWAQNRGVDRAVGDPEFLRAYSARAVEVFKVWKQVFNGDTKGRVVRILAGQFANPWACEQVLAWNAAYKSADALAVAPYFGYGFGEARKAPAVANWSADRLVEELSKEVDGENRELIAKQSLLARKYNLRLLAYEGGQHLAGVAGAEGNDRLTKLFHEANRHPRMYDLYVRHWDNWFNAGGNLYAVFSYAAKPTKWGAWGLLEYQLQPPAEAPKFRAFSDYAAGKPKRAKAK